MTVGLDLSLVISSSNHFQHIIASNRGNPSIGNGYNPYLEDDRVSTSIYMHVSYFITLVSLYISMHNTYTDYTYYTVSLVLTVVLHNI